MLRQVLYPVANPDTMDALRLAMGEVDYIESKVFKVTPDSHTLTLSNIHTNTLKHKLKNT